MRMIRLPQSTPSSAFMSKMSGSTGSIRADGILDFLNQRGGDLIVLATHGRDGLEHWLKGSIAETVFTRFAISTLFVPPSARGFVSEISGDFRLRRVLVPRRTSAVGSQPVRRRIACTGACKDVLTRIADMPQSRLAELLPWNWKQPNLRAAA